VGSEVLIKLVAQFVSTYRMSTFLLPSTLREEIQIMSNYFWWGSNGRHGKRIKWLSWGHINNAERIWKYGFSSCLWF